MDTGKRVQWPGWEIVRRIGSGSFGTVYEIKRDVYGDIEKAALKVISIPHSEDEVDYLRCSGLDDESITQTFHQHVGDIVREYNLMTRLRDNPNIVRCDDFREIQHDDGLGWDIYIKMELLTPLMKNLACVETEQQIIRLGMDICNALMECQKRNIIHRDIKPQNVFVSESGYFKLGDFGIARTMERTTHATAGIGTYSYMAPEIERNEPYGKTADIYSLGLLMYWLLNERRGPFVPMPPSVPNYIDEEQARKRRFAGETIPAPKNGSDALKAIVLRACSFKPEARFCDAAEMFAALKNLQANPAAVLGTRIFITNDVIIPEEQLEKKEPLYKAQADLQEAKQGHDADVTVGVWSFANQKEKSTGSGLRSQDNADARRNATPLNIVEPITTELTADADDSLFSPIKDAEPDIPESKTTGAETYRKKKGVSQYILVILGVIIVILLFLLMKSCGGEKENGSSLQIETILETENTESTIQETANPETTVPTTPGNVDTEQLEWSDWVDELPKNITADKYEIEEKTLYSSRTQEIATSTETNVMAGWELFYTLEADAGFGPWSDWSAAKVESSATREIETQLRYRYRDKETTTSSSSSKSGWTHYDTTYSWGNYGAWSNWSTNAVSSSESRKVETKTQYRYRDITYTTEYTNWSAWSSWQDTEVTETDLRKVETRTVYRYYYYMCPNCGAHMHGYGITCPTWAGGCGKATIARTYYEVWAPIPPNEMGFKNWYNTGHTYAYYEGERVFRNINGDKTKTQYRYATRSTQQVANYGSWSNWGDTAYSNSSTREVQTRTVYRYCDRSKVATYHFYRWGSWSAWSANKVSATNDRQVENTTYYRYRDKVTTTTYYFRRWTEWSEFSETVVEPTEMVDVQTKKQYRYKLK